MVVVYSVMFLLVPAIMTGFGVLWNKNPPEDINCVYGYRTVWSMKSKETWNFAHKYCGKIWRYTGIPLGIMSILILVAFRNCTDDMLKRIVIIITFIQLVSLCLVFIPTEIALRKRFDKEGNRK